MTVSTTPPTRDDPARRVIDLMVWTLARQCRDDDVLVVGVATPMAAAAALLARSLLAPDLTVILAASVDPELHDIARPMLEADLPSRLSAGTFRQAEILDQIQRGRVTLQFVSPAQIDAAGNLNASRVPGPDGTLRRLPGGLAIADVAVLVRRLVAYRAGHSRRFLVPQVDLVTGAGNPAGRAWRADCGLPGRGLVVAVTDRAVLEWPDDGGTVRLASVHPGEDVSTVVADCGFALDPSDTTSTELPPLEAVALLDRVIDPHGIRFLESRWGRAAALHTLEELAR